MESLILFSSVKPLGSIVSELNSSRPQLLSHTKKTFCRRLQACRGQVFDIRKLLGGVSLAGCPDSVENVFQYLRMKLNCLKYPELQIT